MSASSSVTTSKKRGSDSLAPLKNRGGSLFSRALSEGLSAYLPPTALAALEWTSAELNATIRDCHLWQKLTIARDRTWLGDGFTRELMCLGRVIDRKGVQRVFVEEDELDLEFVASLVRLKSATSRQLRFTGRVSRVTIGRVILTNDDHATEYDDSDHDYYYATLDVGTGCFTRANVKALDFVGCHFPDALVVVDGFRLQHSAVIDVDKYLNTSLRAVIHAIDATLHTSGVKRVRVGSYHNITRYSYAHDWDIAGGMEPPEEAPQERLDEVEETVYECTSGSCKCLDAKPAVARRPGGRHFETYVGQLTDTVEEWFDHAWHDWAVGGGGPPDLA